MTSLINLIIALVCGYVGSFTATDIILLWVAINIGTLVNRSE